MIMGIEGGMITASVAELDVTAAAKATGYPFFFIAGIRIEPSAATSATAEPEISAKKSEAEIDTIARPPRMNPNTADANAMSRCEMPDEFMIAPARMKSGIAINGNEVAPLNRTSAALGQHREARHSHHRAHGHDAEGDGDRDIDQDQSQVGRGREPAESCRLLSGVAGALLIVGARSSGQLQHRREAQDPGEDEEQRSNRNDGLRKPGGDPGEADQGVAGQNLEHPPSGPRHHREEPEDERFA